MQRSAAGSVPGLPAVLVRFRHAAQPRQRRSGVDRDDVQRDARNRRASPACACATAPTRLARV